MSFMEPETCYGAFYSVETTSGTTLIPADLCEASLDEMEPFCEGRPISFESVTGWFSRLSAPGYMDCTDWGGPYATEDEAREAIEDLYGGDDDDAE